MKEKINWEQVRIDAAIAAMQSLMGIASFTSENREGIIAELAIEQADALVSKLKNKDDKL